MSLNRILDGLERNTATGAQAIDHARCGFLEWAVSLKGAVTPGTARMALQDPAARTAQSAAAQAFVGFLQQACVSAYQHKQRRSRARGRARVLH